jgi:cardiolipin synthase
MDAMERPGPRTRTRPARSPRVVLRFQRGHRLQLYDRGRAALDAMLDAIRGASHHVHLETYILRADGIGQRVLDALTEQARRGVAVRLLFDAIGSRELDRTRLHELERAGGEIAVFNPPARWLGHFRPRQRDHRKLLIVDGLVGFLGGLNIGDEYVEEEPEGPIWRDAHVRLEGPLLGELEALFMESWFRSEGPSFDWRRLVSARPGEDGPQTAAVLADGPMYRRRRLRDFFLDALARAESRVLLVSPYFSPGPRVLDALGRAGERGVRVELVVAGHSDHPLLKHAAHAVAPALLRRGVAVYEDPLRMMHAKLAVFDDDLSVIGTSNLDRQSLQHSSEVNLVIQGPDTAGWILDRFGPDAGAVRPLTLESLERRSPSERGFDRLAALLSRI